MAELMCLQCRPALDCGHSVSLQLALLSTMQEQQGIIYDRQTHPVMHLGWRKAICMPVPSTF